MRNVKKDSSGHTPVSKNKSSSPEKKGIDSRRSNGKAKKAATGMEQTPFINRLSSGPQIKGGKSKKPNETKLTILQVCPGMTYSEAGSIRMDSVKVTNDLIHFMCIICDSRFSTRDECTEHVSKNHAASGGMCPVLRCSGPLKKHLPPKKCKQVQATKKGRKAHSLPVSKHMNTHHRKQITSKCKRKAVTKTKQNKGNIDMIVVWNTDEVYNQKYQFGKEKHGSSRYVCYHCLKEFTSFTLCRLHMRESHQKQELRLEISKKRRQSEKKKKSEQFAGGKIEKAERGNAMHSGKADRTIDSQVPLTVEQSVEEHLEGSKDRQVHIKHPIDDLLELSASILADDCGRPFGNGSNLVSNDRAILAQHSGSMNIYQCSECSQKFSTFGECGSHMKRVHIPDRDEQTAKDDLNQGVYTLVKNNVNGDPLNISDVEGEESDKRDKPVKEGSDDCKQENEGGREQRLPDEISPAGGEDSEKRQGLKRKRQEETLKRSDLFYPCTECDKIFERPCDLNMHIGGNHCGEGRLRCLACALLVSGVNEEYFKDLSKRVKMVKKDIVAGMKNKGLIEHYFECIVCGAAFRVHKHYNRHVNCHADNYCPLCGLKFHSPQFLYTHACSHKRGPLKCRTI